MTDNVMTSKRAKELLRNVVAKTVSRSDMESARKELEGYGFTARELEMFGVTGDAKDESYYTFCYEKKWHDIHLRLQEEGLADERWDERTDIDFDRQADTDEVVGYYLKKYGPNAYRTWRNNIASHPFYSMMDDKEKSVTIALETVQNVGWACEVRWTNPDPIETPPSKTVVPGFENAEEVVQYMKDTYGEEPQSFIYSVQGNTAHWHRKPGDEVLAFLSEFEMYDYLRENGDLYNPITGKYVFAYNEEGAFAEYDIPLEKAKKLAKEMKESGEFSWSALLGPGGTIHDATEVIGLGISDAIAYLGTIYAQKGWVRADEDTFSEENEKNILKVWDVKPTEWIITTCASPFDGNETAPEIVKGDSVQIRRHLYNCVCNMMAEDRDNYVSGTASPAAVAKKGDSLLATCRFSDLEVLFMATPMNTVRSFDLTKGVMA